MRIDIERLIDAEIEEMDAENSYFHFGKKKYDWFPEYEKRHERFTTLYHDSNHARWQIVTIMEILQCREWKNLYIAARAVKKWRERTEYSRVMPQSMQDQIGKFIFGKEYNA